MVTYRDGSLEDMVVKGGWEVVEKEMFARTVLTDFTVPASSYLSSLL